MIGDTADINARIRGLIPNWFSSDSNPVLDGMLWGFAGVLAWVYDLITYAKNQTRLATATNVGLDAFAFDFFGASLVRGDLNDDAFRKLIARNLFKERATRKAVSDVVESSTGKKPYLFEPRNPQDTGGYGAGAGYGNAGGYGSVLLPYQGFVRFTAYKGKGIPYVYGYGSGGYGANGGAWESLSNTNNTSTQSILSDINETKTAGTLIWACNN